MFWGEGMSWWGYLLMSLNTVLIWGLIIVVIVALFRYVSRGTAQTARPTQQQPTSEQVLAERFARGRSTKKSTGTAGRCCAVAPQQARPNPDRAIRTGCAFASVGAHRRAGRG